MRLSEAFDLYRLDCIVFGNQSASVEESHKYALKFLIEFGGDIQIEDLTFKHVRDWKIHLDKGRNGRPRSVSTVREYIIRLRVVLRHLKKRGHKVLDYELLPVPRRPEKIPDFLTREQVDELIVVVGEPTRGYAKINRMRNSTIISLLWASGIRAAELRQLNRWDIRDDNSFAIIGKGSKGRPCFIDDRTRTYLDAYLALRTDNNPALFIANQNGNRLSKHTLQRIFERARNKVNFNIPIHAHTMRHSFATDLLRNNCNLRNVQAMMGHSSIMTTQIYTHVVDADLQNLHRKFHSSSPAIIEI